MSSQTRRRVLKLTGSTVAGVLVASGLVTNPSHSTVTATGLSAGDVNVTTTDGSLNTLTISPDITVSWTGQEAAVHTVEVTWKVTTGSTSETTIGPAPATFDVSSPSKDGSLNKTMTTINMLSDNGGALTASNFEATTDGGSNSTDVTISMDATLKDSGGNQLASKTDILGPTTYTVTVTNETSSTSSSGTANTSGS